MRVREGDVICLTHTEGLLRVHLFKHLKQLL